MLAQLWSAARDIDNRRSMFLNPSTNPAGRLGFHHFRSPWRGINVAMPARLITLPPDVELKRLQLAPLQHQPVTVQLLFE
jgi:hypothetical protein